MALKIFAGILLLLGTYSGWIVWRAYRQLAAIEKIEKIVRDEKSSEWLIWPGSVVCDPVGPHRLRDLLGEDRMRMFDRISQFNCTMSKSKPQLLKEISCCQDIKSLRIEIGTIHRSRFAAPIKAEFRDKLAGNTNLRQMTDNGFEHLRHLYKLEDLTLNGDLVADHGLNCLEGLPNLVHLNLDNASITDAMALHIGKLSQLRELHLSNTLISDAGLRHFNKLTNLQILDLRETRITDAGLAHLCKFTNLKQLNLIGTEITDSGLVHLRALTSLEQIDVFATNLTEAGVTELKRALPQVQVFLWSY